ncbi:MAG: tyrosine-type recombinase/integrase [Corynebacterium sp.]|uniref:tyrosine-type recombinase/integrase n=1 Tax=Corynebacterium sp. TaxID=1720 RepID=UPI002647A71D|nr:tyrosine-type recombinase/integrase [Corynebacterium sp.]MDN5724001.1 tyrosine-type recombinase/integrase [Corynebacterium sp.]
MSTLREDVADYLATRRAMGFKVEGLSKLLTNFVTFCEARGAVRVQNEIAVEWAATPIKVPVTDALFARRMDAVRIFARFQHALDPDTQIPPERICRRRYQPREPNVFDQTQIVALLAAADTLSPRFKAVTWRTLIGLLATTGMRPGEACRLVLDDVDLTDGLLRIVDTKFGKSRFVFLHPSTVTVLNSYLQVRHERLGTNASICGVLFVNTRAGALDPDKLGATFKQIVAIAGIPTRPGHRPPRLYDLRHSFAATTMLEWYRQGRDVQVALPLLSTWLGHVDPASTYWYLHAVPELLACASGLLDAAGQSAATEATS